MLIGHHHHNPKQLFRANTATAAWERPSRRLAEGVTGSAQGRVETVTPGPNTARTSGANLTAAAAANSALLASIPDLPPTGNEPRNREPESKTGAQG